MVVLLLLMEVDNKTMLNGYKTYIVAILIIVTTVLNYYGILSSDITNLLYGILGGTGAITLRSAVTRA